MESPDQNMTPGRPGKPVSRRADAVDVVRRLRDAGHTAYFAGGCVRDALLSLEPKDYDVATDADPAKVRELFSNTQAIGAAFGVILVRQGSSMIEVATFRADGRYTDGRRPDQIRFASAEEDAQRRDFTINGLFFDPIENRLIDFVGGRDDLAQKRLRAIGDPALRFEEDHLRMLRAVRFAARFDLEIDPATQAAIHTAAPRLKSISPERIAEELRMILTPPTRSRAWHLVWALDLAKVLFRLLLHTDAEGAGPRSIFLALPQNQTIDFGLALAAAVLDARLTPVGDLRKLLEKSELHASITAMRKTLRISNEESDAMTGTLTGLAPLLSDAEPTVAVKKRFLAQPTANLSRQLMAALASVGWFAVRAAKLAIDLAELEQTNFAPTPLMTGDDLTDAGFTPGPLFRRLLEGVYDAQLEGKIITKEEAMDLARKLTRPA